MAPPTLNYGGGDRIAYAQTQLWVWLHYLRLFVLPVGLSADTDLTLISSLVRHARLAGACALAALVWVGVRCAKVPRAWPVTFGLAWFAIGLLPTSSVIPLAEPLNEHRVFLPYIGLVLSAVWGARLLLADRVRFATRDRGRSVSRSSSALPGARTSATARGGRARGCGRTSRRRVPGTAAGWMNYGTALMARGDYAQARECYERAALLTPNYWTLEINRGIVEEPSAARRRPRRTSGGRSSSGPASPTRTSTSRAGSLAPAAGPKPGSTSRPP